MKNKLNVEQMASVLFLLCSDVALLGVKGKYFYYFKPRAKSNIPAIRYILRKNGVHAQRHRSQYYGSLYARDNLILRVPKFDFDRHTNNGFRMMFEQKYVNRYDYVSVSVNGMNVVGRSFRIRTNSGKEKILSRIADRNR